MEVSAGWMQQQQSGIGFDELSSMVSELMAHFERQSSLGTTPGSVWSPDWLSPTAHTRVIRHGSSASLQHVLMQASDTVSAEYEVLYKDACVFTWQEYLWPHLRQDTCGMHTAIYYLPEDCLNELMDFHVRNRTHWLGRYQRKRQASRSAEIDKVGVVAQAHLVEAG